MKTTYTTAAQCLLFLAACLPAAAQTDVNSDRGSDGSSQISAGSQKVQVKALQRQLESYDQQLRAKAEKVEDARQQAISAGIQGDGAGPFIDAYRQEQKELEVLQSALTPKIEQTRAMIANLTKRAAPSVSASSPKLKPVRPGHAIIAASSSHTMH